METIKDVICSSVCFLAKLAVYVSLSAFQPMRKQTGIKCD